MTAYVRPPYCEELRPIERVPDYVPATPAATPAAAATETADDAAAPAAGAVAVTPLDKQTIRRTGHISSPVHRVERAGGLAVSFTLTVAEDDTPPTTYRVYATTQFAERLAKQPLAPGCLVEVAGQAQLRQERQPDGAARRALPLLLRRPAARTGGPVTGVSQAHGHARRA
jgi:hypothetical protein